MCQDQLDILSPGCGDFRLIFVSFGSFLTTFWHWESSKDPKSAIKLYYHISFCHLTSFITIGDMSGPVRYLQLRFWWFRANFGNFWHIFDQFLALKTSKDPKSAIKLYYHISFCHLTSFITIGDMSGPVRYLQLRFWWFRANFGNFWHIFDQFLALKTSKDPKSAMELF